MEVEKELRARVEALSLEQKVRLLTGADFWALHPEPAIGLRRLVMSDGPAGVRGERWDEREPSANVPSPTALAATWDEDLVARIGVLLAAESRRKGVDVLLAPTINLHRTPYGGRHFENFSEDPLLVSRIGAAFVRGVQSGGVAATVKHFVANDTETERFSADVLVDDRTLREVYLPPFEETVREAGAWVVMAAYNAVNGATMTESPLLRDVLKGEWGFDGVVVSDWYAARSLAAAGPGLLDVAMPGPDGPWGRALVDAARAGEVPAEAVDDKVLRMLRLAARVGALEGIAAEGGAAPRFGPAEVAEQLRAGASAGFVLLENGPGVLPVDATQVRRVAVLGPNAEVARTLGGGSATVSPPYVVSPLEGLRTALGHTASGAGVEVVSAVGCRPSDRVPPAPGELLAQPDTAAQGAQVRFLSGTGEVLATEARHASVFVWNAAVADGVKVSDVRAVEVHTVLTAPQAGTWLVGGSGLGRFTLHVDGAPALDETTGLAAGADVVEGLMRPPQAVHRLDLAQGQQVEVVLRHEPTAPEGSFGDAEIAMLMMQLNAGLATDDDVEIARAVEIARDSDVAVLVVGTTEEVESEGFDRSDLALPGRQDELVRRVAEVNPRTVVVVNAGAPVLMPWSGDVAAVLLGWFPGQEFGNALADVLLGVSEPGGRLPTTWPAAEKGLPSPTPAEGRLAYDEGLLVGHRAFERDGRAPAYPFGHGLGYTTWEYAAVEAHPEDGGAVVTVDLRNAGDRRGREVVQVYASRPGSAVERPPRWLAGFAAVDLDAGETARVRVVLAARAFQHWDVDRARWTGEPGDFALSCGRSAADVRLETTVRIP